MQLAIIVTIKVFNIFNQCFTKFITHMNSLLWYYTVKMVASAVVAFLVLLLYFIYVTGFVKRGLPHTCNFHTLTIHNFPYEWAIELKFGLKWAKTL